MIRFTDTVIAAVVNHMNGDHPEDNLLIVRAFGAAGATESFMVGLSEQAGLWRVQEPTGERELVIDWLGGPIAERHEIRREVVALYQEACIRLGVKPRAEHESVGTTTPAFSPTTNLDAEVEADAESAPFSKAIRETSWGDHSDSEGAGFMDDIIKGRGTRQDYTDLVAQHYFMYEALELAAKRLVADPELAVFHPDALVRLPAIEADLEFLVGEDWRNHIAPVAATEAYVARIHEIDAEQWLSGIVAHHYTRYLGDLSGGQMIARLVAKQHGFTDGGIDFYDFSDLGPIPNFKNSYRAGLDRLGASLDQAERARFIEEVRTAYGFNTAVFVDLSRRKAAGA